MLIGVELFRKHQPGFFVDGFRLCFSGIMFWYFSSFPLRFCHLYNTYIYIYIYRWSKAELAVQCGAPIVLFVGLDSPQ